MHCPIYAGERAGADQIENFVSVEEEAGFFALQQPFDLVVGQNFTAHKSLHEILDADINAAKRGPDVLVLLLRNQAQIACALSNLFGIRMNHADASQLT